MKQTMKHLLLLMLIFPSLLWAQDNSKYLTGAVPVKDGKVVFSKEIKKAGQSKEQLFNTMLDWAKKYFNTDESRVVFSDLDDGDIAAVAKQELIFKSNAFVLDRTFMTYRCIISCMDEVCNINVENIRYSYNVAYQDEPERYSAEEWITDENALNSKRTKLNISSGKFRAKTIDFVETLFAESSKALGVDPGEGYVAPKTAKSNVPDALFSGKKRKGYTSYSMDQVPQTLIKMLPESKMYLTPDDQPKLKESKVSWKGLGNIFGKAVATISIDKNTEAYEALGKEGEYAVTFFKDKEEEPWFIIECVKQGETVEGEQVSVMGEVLNIWVK